MREALHGLVVRMQGNPHTQEDWFQEALLYLWSTEHQHPGQTPSWYLQGVKFFLLNLKTFGRSLDSPKRRSAQAWCADKSYGLNDRLDTFECDEGFLSAVNAHDIFCLLVVRLKPMDQRILRELAQGEGIRDIANQLTISHQSVLRGRKRIAALAIKLGVVPPNHSPNRVRVCQATVR